MKLIHTATTLLLMMMVITPYQSVVQAQKSQVCAPMKIDQAVGGILARAFAIVETCWY